MLLSLMDGRALTASELAAVSDITKQTASSHLSQLLHGGLLVRVIQGRHHYYRLSDPDIGQAIEALLVVAARGPGNRARAGPKDPALRKSRICYDHLAGELGVLMLDQMRLKRWLNGDSENHRVTLAGWQALASIGVTPDNLPKTKRPLCKTCLDWSMRRHHLAGQLGARVLERFFTLRWARRVPDTRIIVFTPSGEAAFRAWLD